MAPARALLISHVVVFVAGFAIGKKIDSDELEAYRSINESDFARLRRNLGTAVLGLGAAGAVGTVVVLVLRGTKPRKS